ncbi:MAG: exodeoxyribonuclease V, partial [Actinomycetota bacterium]|nr:exodeoxyribonuclease V [Actinomycetota bacterium]
MTAGPGALAESLTVALPPHVVSAATRYYGEQAGAVLAGDPWALLAVPGCAPGQADALAAALGAPVDGRRDRALIGWLLA